MVIKFKVTISKYHHNPKQI